MRVLPARDPGLQPERTELSWRRTRLALVVAALAVARHPLSSGRPGLQLGVAVAVAVAVLGVVLLALRPRAFATTAGLAASLGAVELGAVCLPG